ncbi:MAG: hypothetical protein KAR83_08330 [Thermodesulfovibrionales bacterium]|nr:hypothetical protein [Thermodesulfovibrionales bacterium]
MFTREMKCGACGFEGKVEAHDTVNVVLESQIFMNLGKDSSTGYLHFSCPSCNEDLAVDPLKVISVKQMVGYPASYKTSGIVKHSNRHVPIIWGIAYLVIAAFIFLKFSGWWTYIVGGILLMLAWVSIKTGLFPSENEINELTESEPVSEETKKRFQERL